MSEQEIIYISLIMQLIVDGKADTSKLSPGAQKFLDGCIENYLEDPEDSYNHHLYHYATVMLNPEKEKLH